MPSESIHEPICAGVAPRAAAAWKTSTAELENPTKVAMKAAAIGGSQDAAVVASEADPAGCGSPPGRSMAARLFKPIHRLADRSDGLCSSPGRDKPR
jgi:hypothetical protein